MLSSKKTIAILGSTGSIGITSLNILKSHKNKFKINLLCCNKNKLQIYKQIKTYLPKFVIINDLKTYNFFLNINFKKKIKFFKNIEEFDRYNKKIKNKFDKTILGISSIAGLKYAFSFMKYSKEILIANKESIVCGGKYLLNEAKKYSCKIISIDSEHFCLANTLKFFKLNQIKKIYLTASGGPFLDKNKNEISKIDSKFALKHPNWKMGKKISIDSATMANKGLEVIEASILFNIDPKKIGVKIHKESKVHSVVTLFNGLVYLVAHNTSMKIPISNSLLDNYRQNINNNFFDNKSFSFTFDEKKLNNFKMLSLAYKSLQHGQRACIFYNVINDHLVNLYLQKKIFFYEIHYKLNKIMLNKKLFYYFRKKIKNINDIYQTISMAQYYAKKI